MLITLITILFLSLIIGAYYIHESLLLRKLNNPDYKIRLRGVEHLAKRLEAGTFFNETRTIDWLFGVMKDDEHWFVRLEALKAVADYLYPKKLMKRLNVHLSRNLEGYKLAAVDTWLNVLEHDESEVQAVAAIALGRTRSIRAIKPLLKALNHIDTSVRVNAITALAEACVSVRTVVFGSKKDEQDFKRQQKEGNPDVSLFKFSFSEVFLPKNFRGVVSNPDVSLLTAPMNDLQYLVIDTETCDISQVTAFAKYMLSCLHENVLKTHVNIYVAGNPTLFSSDVYQAFPKCKSVDVSIETVIFGNASTTPHDPYKTVMNPDFSVVTIPMPRLKTLIIHADTYDFRQIEYFLTYAVNYIGQNRLKKFVDVHIYGDPATLHPNLRNSFTNLCKVVIAHEPHE
jgi:hypothetical protein